MPNQEAIEVKEAEEVIEAEVSEEEAEAAEVAEEAEEEAQVAEENSAKNGPLLPNSEDSLR